MASVNKVILVGNLGRDPEVRATPGGQTVAKFSIATTERWKNRQTGQNEEKTEWHNIVVWGRLAELCRDYLSKGRQVYIEGRIQTRTYEDKEGKKAYFTEIIAQDIRFLGSRNEGGARPPAPSEQQQTSPAATPAGSGQDLPAFDEEDDIPF